MPATRVRGSPVKKTASSLSRMAVSATTAASTTRTGRIRYGPDTRKTVAYTETIPGGLWSTASAYIDPPCATRAASAEYVASSFE